MSEAYTYGGNGSVERVEYNELNEYELGVSIERVSETLEAIFVHTPSSPGIVNEFSQDKEGMYRKVSSTYFLEGESTFLFNSDDGSIMKILDAPVVKDINIEYAFYTEGVLREEYIMKIVENDPGTNGAFSTRYHLSNFKGGLWQATVEHIDVENDNFNMLRTQNNSKFYRRTMTSYDFDELLKDSAEIKDQLGIVLVQ